MKRLENGLVENLEYIKDEKTGRINWLKMVPMEYLYINQDRKTQLEKRLNKSFKDIKIEEVPEKDLVITLQGIRYILDLRGYKSAKSKIDIANNDYVCATCEITFIANEEENFEQVFSSSASAHPGNAKSFYRNYLVEAATNRALCRAVRNFLKIDVVSREELGNSDIQEEPQNNTLPDIFNELTKLMIAKNVSLNDLNKEFGKNKIWESIDQIPKATVFTILGKLKQS